MATRIGKACASGSRAIGLVALTNFAGFFPMLFEQSQFTAAAIMLLADEGELAVADEITRYLPDYPAQGKRITIEHLLTHTSGIKSYTDMPTYVEIIDGDMTVLAAKAAAIAIGEQGIGSS